MVMASLTPPPLTFLLTPPTGGISLNIALNIRKQLAPNILVLGNVNIACFSKYLSTSFFDSPFSLYNGNESLANLCSLLLYGRVAPHLSAISFEALLGSSALANQTTPFNKLITERALQILDPSFSHCLFPDLLSRSACLGLSSQLLVIWRNPISYIHHLQAGIYSLDLTIQFCRYSANPIFDLPLDPLGLWVNLVSEYLLLLNSPSWENLSHAIRLDQILDSVDMISSLSPLIFHSHNTSRMEDAILDIAVEPFLYDSPFSGPPPDGRPIIDSQYVSISELSRTSPSTKIIDTALGLCEKVGYLLT